MRRLLIGALLCFMPSLVSAQGGDAEPYDPQAMRAAREAVKQGMGGQTQWLVNGERVEYRSNDGNDALLWDLEGWVGGDINKFWIKTEGEYIFPSDKTEEASVESLYVRAIAPLLDFQTGIRQDFGDGPDRTHFVLGLMGVAPMFIEFDANAYLSDKGDLTFGVEAEYDLPLTQRLILQPRVELAFSAQDIEELGIGSGLSSIEGGLRLRYEWLREFAPYIGVSWTRAVGDTADFARADGEEVKTTSFVAGIRFWF
jgi:copper resistance protein B